MATSCKELTHWKKLWCWEGLGAGGEGDNRGWDGWMASLTRWTWVWVNSRRWWWTGRPGVLRFIWSQRVGHDWATELNWTDIYFINNSLLMTLISFSFQVMSTLKYLYIQSKKLRTISVILYLEVLLLKSRICLDFLQCSRITWFLRLNLVINCSLTYMFL